MAAREGEAVFHVTGLPPSQFGDALDETLKVAIGETLSGEEIKATCQYG